MLSLYPWLNNTWEQWQALSVSDRVNGAFLCASSVGNGTEDLIRLWVKTLLCETSAKEPCDLCHSCHLVNAGNHPDLHWIQPEKEGKVITVDQIRECNRKAMDSSQLGGKRIIIISPAENMNESASNALLKTLESPPEHCVFILLTHNRSRLLPTITSRCQKWAIAEPPITETFAWLQQQGIAHVNYTGIRLCAQAPLTAKAFFEQDNYADFQQLETLFIQSIQQGDLNGQLIECALKEDPIRNLFWLSVLLSDVQKIHFGLTQVGLCPGAELLSQVLPYSVTFDAMLKLNRIIDQIRVNSGLNAELLLTGWLIEIQEELCL